VKRRNNGRPYYQREERKFQSRRVPPSSGDNRNFVARNEGQSERQNILWFGCGALLVIFIITGFIAIQRAAQCLNSTLRECIGLPTPTPTITTGIIRSHLREAGELTTYVLNAETRVNISQAEEFLGFETGRYNELIFQAYGEVRAGINLDEISDSDIQISRDEVTIYLPEPRILDAKIDVNRSYVAEVNRPFLRSVILIPPL
jgi:hypothetical protein